MGSWDGTVLNQSPQSRKKEKALKPLKPDKAVRPDGIPSEMLKLGAEKVTKALHRIIKTVWTSGQWPQDWVQSTFVPLYKKGDPTVCANYRIISLISHVSKIMLKVILGRNGQRSNSKWTKPKPVSVLVEARTHICAPYV